MDINTKSLHTPGAQEPAMAPPETISDSAASILPRELLDLTVPELGDDKTTLRHFKKTCRHWLPCARAHLSQYTTFTLHCFRDDRSADPTPGLRALVSSAHCSILPYITDLTIDVHWRQMELLDPSLALLPSPAPINHASSKSIMAPQSMAYLPDPFHQLTTLRFTDASTNFDDVVLPRDHRLPRPAHARNRRLFRLLALDTLARVQAHIRVADFSTPQSQSSKESRMLRCVRFIILVPAQRIRDVSADQDREIAHTRGRCLMLGNVVFWGLYANTSLSDMSSIALDHEFDSSHS
ncbi:hypothetical protein C8R44DRAFT_891709 [Mycena epipterygia]|nr:hypothetical protein C8R44DRAFT_891709 [Mycena epipterygia]